MYAEPLLKGTLHTPSHVYISLNRGKKCVEVGGPSWHWERIGTCIDERERERGSTGVMTFLVPDCLAGSLPIEVRRNVV